MTNEEYRQMIHSWGFTPIRGGQRAEYSLYESRDKEVTTIPNPEGMTPEERLATIELLRTRFGITPH